jgi:hypothetical protein
MILIKMCQQLADETGVIIILLSQNLHIVNANFLKLGADF